MNTIVGVYNSHDKAINAIAKIKEAGFPATRISLISKAEEKDKHMHVKSSDGINIAEVSVGLVAGPVLGILTGVGLFAIPGFGYLFGAGAIIGAVAGFDLGLIGAGALSFLTLLGVNRTHHEKYHAHLSGGNFLVIAQCSDDEEVKIVKSGLEKYASHIELNVH